MNEQLGTGVLADDEALSQAIDEVVALQRELGVGEDNEASLWLSATPRHLIETGKRISHAKQSLDKIDKAYPVWSDHPEHMTRSDVKEALLGLFSIYELAVRTSWNQNRYPG